MRAIYIGPPDHTGSSRKPTHWVAVADYVPGEQPTDIPLGPTTKGFGEYSLVDAVEIANEEAARLGLPLVDLSRGRLVRT